MGKVGKRKLKKQHSVYKKSGAALFFEKPAGKLTVFFGIIAAVTAIVLLVIFVIVPSFDASSSPNSHTLKKNTFRDLLDTSTNASETVNSISAGVAEAAIDILTVNDPYIYKDEILFTTSSMQNGSIKYNKLYIYNCADDTEHEITGLSLKYDDILFPRMNDDYIIFLDSSLSGGGRICCYNRETGVQYAVKDYLYAAPQIELSGNTIVFMQQAGEDLDRLYLFDLDARESAAYRIFSGLSLAPTPVDACGSTVVYAIPYQTDDGYDRSRIYTLDLTTGKEKYNEPGKLIYQIKTDGAHTAFLSSSSGAPTDLYILDGVTPMLLVQDVANFEMEAGYIAYTQNDVVYAYSFDTKLHYRVNSEISRAYLCSANGDKLAFMDVTGGFADTVNTIKYLEVSFPNGG